MQDSLSLLRLFPAFALAAFFIMCGSVEVSHAQTTVPQLAIYVQIVVQDSSGNLVSYLESDRVTVIDPAKLNDLLNEDSPNLKRSMINVGAEKYEMIKVVDTRVHQSPTIVSLNLITTDVSGKTETLAIANHDGYPVVRGDKVTTFWTILRPAS